MLKILVVGAGAIGCFVGGRLAAAGNQVTLLGRPALMNKIAAEGLVLQHPTQPNQTVSPNIATDVHQLSSPYDFILVTVKAPSTAEIIDQITAAPFSIERSYVVSLQNGIGNEKLLADAFGAERVIAGTVTIPISVPDLGVIAVSKDKGGLGLAPLRVGQPVDTLATALEQVGLTTPIYEDWQAMKWSKLLLNIINNASSAILDETPARIIDNTDLFNMEIEALREGLAVMKAMDINAVKLPGYAVDWLARLLNANWLPLAMKRTMLRPAMVSGRGSKMPSLHIDLEAGRTSTEIMVLNGAIVAAGQKLGIATPVNLTLTETFKAVSEGRVDWSQYRHQPQTLLKAVALAR
ncbi:MAG: 2-dehydropantoate 2-reductase [Anaerolineae bacterium]|nr:2-dehydropantoate 2-reductase [Anaerolineae bacterium]